MAFASAVDAAPAASSSGVVVARGEPELVHERAGLLARAAGLGEARFERLALLLAEHAQLAELGLHQLELLLCLAVGFVCGHRDAPVELGARHALEQLRALVGAGAQEGREVALREQRGAAKLLEAEAEALLDGGEHLGARTADALAAVELAELEALQLQLAVDAIARAPHRPARAVAFAAAALEIDLCEAAGRASAQDRAHVVGAEALLLVVVVSTDGRPTPLIEPRRLIEEREAERVEQRALARARGPGDREEPRARERPGVEAHLEGPRDAREVLSPNGEDPHRLASCCARSTST